MTMTAAAVAAASPPCHAPHTAEGGEEAAESCWIAASAPARHRIPAHYPGQRIGLFGGTFDPPHEAHLAACLLAMKRLALDQVWWLVTPGNPLKNTTGL